MDLSRYERAFQRIVFELRPYLDEIVIIGGWVPYLYKRYGGFESWQAETSLTAEVDVLVDRPLSTKDRRPLADLLREAHFHAVDDGGLAVWEGKVELGEKIEFLVPHEGTARQAGRVVRLPEQRGLGAISLEGVGLLRRCRRQLTIPVATSRGAAPLEIWVPALGAYAVSKASTYARRGGDPKAAKDLLYLRDLMKAGSEVVDRIDSDLAEMARDLSGHSPVRLQIRYAWNTLSLALDGSLRKLLPEVAKMLAEREPALTMAAAEADISGHLSDLVQLLEERAE
jgi:hypothetical protein